MTIDCKENHTHEENENRRIAKNAVILFVRMLIITVINLVSVRFVFRALGEIDFGIYTTIASVVTISSILSNLLALAVQRFYSVAIGKNNQEELRRIFSTSINIVILLTIIVLLFFESVGLWFVYYKLVIPSARHTAMLWLYQMSIATFLFSLFTIPFSGAVFAHENMGCFALISTLICILKLCLALLLTRLSGDLLIVYGLGLLIIGLLELIIYIVYSKHNYKECRYRKVWDKRLLIKMTTFSGWTGYGALANMGITQGNSILLNLFFGPLANAAYGIAQQINIAFTSLTNNIVIPFRPAMIKAYASNRFDYLNTLFNISSKLLLYLLILISIPIIIEMKSILQLWLGFDISQETIDFARLIIIYVIIMAMANPITIIFHASGQLKQYHLPTETIAMLCLPLSWILFKIGFPSIFVFYTTIAVSLIAHCVRLICLHRYYKFISIRHYLIRVVLPGILLAAIASTAAAIAGQHASYPLQRFFVVVITSSALVILLTYFFGLNFSERAALRKFILSKISVRNNR